MRINYFSDLHLEFGPLAAPDNNADIIVAAGDIGVGMYGLNWLKSLNKPVIYVAGNHEFYGQEYRQTLQSIREQCQGSKVYFLENDCFIFQGVRFLGCTLWTDLFVEGDENAEMLRITLNDFWQIRYADNFLDLAKFSQLHCASKAWLEQQLAQPFLGKTVVITHHAPILSSWRDSSGALKRLAYCNDLAALLHEHNIALWFHGHVHCALDYHYADSRILCNPRGYFGAKSVADFDCNKMVEI